MKLKRNGLIALTLVTMVLLDTEPVEAQETVRSGFLRRIKRQRLRRFRSMRRMRRMLRKSRVKLPPVDPAPAKGYAFQTLTALVYDVSDIDEIQQIREVALEGQYVATRMIDGVLYLVTEKWARPPAETPVEDTLGPLPGLVTPFSPGVTAPGASGGAAAPEHSTTNIQVQGVDEGDIVKTDGRHIFYANRNQLLVIEASSKIEPSVKRTLEFGSQFSVEELYLRDDRLVVVGHNSGLLDEPAKFLKESAPADETPAPNDLALLPLYLDTTSGPDFQLLNLTGIEYFPDRTFSTYLLMTGFNILDLDTPVQPQAFIGEKGEVYVSRNNLFIAKQEYRSSYAHTEIRKFELREGRTAFVAAGAAPGRILNRYSMDEHEGHFRVATTTGHNIRNGESTSHNHVFVLDEQMDIAGRVENLAPGERIYSARFVGRRGYLVTFRKVDPLFVISLADPSAPEVLGELKVTGYSDYLHPYDEHHVLGFGKETRQDDPEAQFSWYQGIKVALFDVSDATRPKQKFALEIGDRGSQSKVLREPKALLFDRKKNLLAFPVSISKKEKGTSLSSFGERIFDGAIVFNVTLERGFQLKGKVSHSTKGNSTPTNFWGYGSNESSIKRLLYIGVDLYTFSERKVQVNDLESLNEKACVELP